MWLWESPNEALGEPTEVRPPWGPCPQRLGAKISEKSRDKGGNFQTDQGTMVKTVQKL